MPKTTKKITTIPATLTRFRAVDTPTDLCQAQWEVKGTGIKHRPDPIEEPACQKGMQKCAVAYYFNLLISLSISDGETRPIDLDNTSPRLK